MEPRHGTSICDFPPTPGKRRGVEGLSLNHVLSSDKPLTGRTRQTMLTEAACRLAAAIQARNDLTVHIHDLAMRIDAQTGSGVVNDRSGPGGMEWRSGDFMQRSGLAKV